MARTGDSRPLAPSAATKSSPDRETSIASFVRARRRANGLSLRALADLAGVGLRFLNELEHGKRTLRLDRVDAVLAVFGKQVGAVDRERG